MNIDQPVILNEEISKKYESYSSSVDAKTETLDEPVIETVVYQILARNETSKISIKRSPQPSLGMGITKKLGSNGTYGDHLSFLW